MRRKKTDLKAELCTNSAVAEDLLFSPFKQNLHISKSGGQCPLKTRQAAFLKMFAYIPDL